MRAAIVQINACHTDREMNVANALRLVDEAAAQGAEFVLLPEYMTFNGSYSLFEAMSETVPGSTTELISAKAKEHGISIHAGSLIEKSEVPGKFYNTSTVFNPQGELVATYRKMHLFDIDVPGEIKDTESAYIKPGEQLRTVDMPGFRLGLSICFDLRFPELYRALAGAGAEVLVIPSLFAMATGKVHWHILARAKAIENHAFVLAAGQHGQNMDGAPFFAHSLIVDPWGTILAEAPGDAEAVIVADLDLSQVARRREQIQVLELRHPELYSNVERL
jgi:deaminated glutathione amidase